MTRPIVKLLLCILPAGIGTLAYADHRSDHLAQQKARDILARFARSDDEWQTRLRLTTEVVKAGSAAVPVLFEALNEGPLRTRLFAGEMLVLMVEPGKVDARMRAALEHALEDREDFVREFAIKALYNLGELNKVELARQIADNDPSRDIRRVTSAALRGEYPKNEPAIRKALATFDPATIDTARLGQPAPDFALPDPSGKIVRLSNFRGKKSVALVFLAEDD
jgi:hypothetical protein